MRTITKLASLAALLLPAPGIQPVESLGQDRPLRQPVHVQQAFASAVADQQLRNPFGVNDIPDPDGKDVQQLAAQVDPNAEAWVKESTAWAKGSLDGEWFERWNGPGGDWHYGKGPAQVKTVGDRVYILVDSANGRFLIDLKRDRSRLSGRYRGIDNPNDTGPCVFLVVGDDRLDGNWSGTGRWDFRRKAK